MSVSKAIARFSRISPRKARMIVNLVRGRQAGEALQLLQFTMKAGAPVIAKLIESAVANASTPCSSRRPSSTRPPTSTCAAGVPEPWVVRPGSRRASATSPSTSARASKTNMGQKVHPYGFRLGVIKTWNSKWFEDKNYAKWLHEDMRIKRAVKEYLMNANIASVEVERAANKAKVIVFTARPGMVIGKGGKGIEILKIGNLKTAVKGETKFAGVQSFTDNEVFIDVQEIRKAETSAQLVAENVAMQLERRVAFRRAMKKALSTAMKFGAKGIRIRCSGRLGGSEMSRVETYREGRVPLHTLRADIEFGQHEARTKYGIIGVKCWVFKGEVLARRQRRPQIAGA
jgi:small subunit ribosomal protein S3